MRVKCAENGKDACRREIRDSAGHARYYVEPYDINGVKYHICSQWWSSGGDISKDMLKMLAELSSSKLL